MQNKMTPILAIIAVLAIVGIFFNEIQKPAAPKPEPIYATIVGVYRGPNDVWSTSLKWGNNDEDRGAWSGKLGQEGERVRIYKMPDGSHQIAP